ncbi:phage head closure protein [uncultured Microbulbifer sp.]|uniref:phage head closure protein n=1 Tax=uncultured Microbulbifer sp. TaxID=348147 RepID=UPI0026286AA2|nr:phage head closure protein [uncultured Microbulbifer sp.]
MAKRVNKLGRLRYRVTLQKPTRVRNSESGDFEDSWADIDTVWASFDALSASEFIQASAETSELVGQMEIFKRSDIDTQCRVLWDGSTYEISGILPIPERGRLRLMVNSGVRP